jgi:DNA-binding response OmpR family regulator
MAKVFLAEDDQMMVALLETLLKIEGFDVVSIDLADGDLLSSLREDVPKILLLDVNLPNENGMNIVSEMRKDDLFKDTRVVMASGMSLKAECLASGADDFLLKPYMPDELISILRRYAQR